MAHFDDSVDGYLRHAEDDEDIAYAKRKSEVNAENGRKGGKVGKRPAVVSKRLSERRSEL
jgi:hypothetical protein